MAGSTLASATASAAPAPRRAPVSPWREAWRRFRKHRLAVLSAAVLALLVLAVLVVEAVRTAMAEFGAGEELSEGLIRAMVLFACFAFAFLFFSTSSSNLPKQNTPAMNIETLQNQNSFVLTLTECFFSLAGTNHTSSTR